MRIKSLVAAFFLFSSITCAFANTFEISKNKVINYTDHGDGAPLVLIHAFPTDHRLWDAQQEPLQKYFRVITLDLIGFGQSSKTNGQAISMNEYATDVKQLMDHLRIKNATIGGESMGGYVALAMLEKYPDKVDSLILSNTQAIADNADTRAKREVSAKEILKSGTLGLIDGYIKNALSTHASKQTKETLRAILTSQPATGMASALRGMSARQDTSQALANSSRKILIITSDQDAVLPAEQGQKMHTLAKNSKLVLIKNAGHLSSMEQPQQWNQAVIDMFYVKPIA